MDKCAKSAVAEDFEHTKIFVKLKHSLCIVNHSKNAPLNFCGNTRFAPHSKLLPFIISFTKPIYIILYTVREMRLRRTLFSKELVCGNVKLRDLRFYWIIQQHKKLQVFILDTFNVFIKNYQINQICSNLQLLFKNFVIHIICYSLLKGDFHIIFVVRIFNCWSFQTHHFVGTNRKFKSSQLIHEPFGPKI